MQNSGPCTLCLQIDETIHHLLLGCVYSWDVWFLLLQRVDIVTPGFKGQNQMLIVCMLRIKLSYIRSECKHRIPMSLLYHILLQKFITSPERTKQRNGPHLATAS
jgi:hypothetical protein